MRFKKLLISVVMLIGFAFHGNAISFALDSIATWGKFPNFCIKTYRWGDKFFNGYDSTYVKGTGYKMNVKMRTNSWFENTHFVVDWDKPLMMRTPSVNTIGFDVTYLAVSVGYDFSINRLFGGVDRKKSKFNFDFTCGLFTASLYSIKNDVGMNIRRIGDLKHINEPFTGVDNKSWGVDAVYFFNHKRFSYAAAFSFSKLQLRSQGSFFIGLSYNNRNLTFDFTEMPENLQPYLSEALKDATIVVKEQTYGIKGGYAFNWVPNKHITVGVSEALIPSLSHGEQTSVEPGESFRIYNRLNLACVWNNNRWFAGIVGKSDVAIVHDEKTILANSLFSMEIKVGWRFNLW